MSSPCVSVEVEDENYSQQLEHCKLTHQAQPVEAQCSKFGDFCDEIQCYEGRGKGKGIWVLHVGY